MQDGPIGNRRGLVIGIVCAILGILLLIAFGRELWQTIGVLWNMLVLVFTRINLPMPAGFERSVSLTCFNCLFGFLFFFLVWLFLVSRQAILPVTNLLEVYRTAFHTVLFALHLHGPAVLVQNGEVRTTYNDERRFGPGVIVVDFNSAVVLEEMVLNQQLPFQSLLVALLELLGLCNTQLSPRVVGSGTLTVPGPKQTKQTLVRSSGIVFTRPFERIRGAVDLRQQFRLRTDARAYTLEGIEFSTNVNAMFTVGQPADVLFVVYDGPATANNLRVARITRIGTRRIQFDALADTLDPDDRAQIHQQIQSGEAGLRPPGGWGPNFSFLESNNFLAQPPAFNAAQVCAAMFSEARDADEELIPWADLPAKVATEQFRAIVHGINYDWLYTPQTNGQPLPIFLLRNQLSVRMRNLGILSYRFIGRPQGMIQVGQSYTIADLLISQTLPLTSPRVLRNRGIKVIASGFGDLTPVSDVVYKQRLDSWRATWERDNTMIRAGQDLEAMRIRSRAQAKAQRDLYATFTQLLTPGKYSKEALAIRVLQAMDALAAAPRARQLLSGETVSMLANIRNWLIPPPIFGAAPIGTAPADPAGSSTAPDPKNNPQ